MRNENEKDININEKSDNKIEIAEDELQEVVISFVDEKTPGPDEWTVKKILPEINNVLLAILQDAWI